MQLFLTAAQNVLYNKMVEQRKKRMKLLSEIQAIFKVGEIVI